MSYYSEHITDGFLCCGNSGNEEKTEKTMTFRRSNLIESIKVMAGITANGLKDAERTDELKHHLDDIAEGGNMDRLNEVIDIALLECVQVLEKICTMEKATSNEITDDYVLQDEWHVRLSLPGKMHEHTAELICKYIHELVCLSVIEDYLGLMGVDNASLFEARVENLLDKIGKSLRTKKRSTKPMTII